jgi:nucleotide-binding universal stress UspA family protein
MTQLKKILFPVDFSERCVGAARYVQAFAGWFDAELMLLHVIDAGTYASAGQSIQPARQEQLNAFLADELKHYATRRVCTLGDPAEEIAKAARSWSPDLVMMPSYGIGFYRPFLLGSVTAKVLNDVECPVWTGVHTEAAPRLESISISKVLCAVDLGDRSRAILEWAAALARHYEAALGIVHVAPLAEAPTGQRADRELAEAITGEAQRRITALEASEGLNAEILVTRGEPEKAVACAAKNFNADLLVIGRHSGSGEEGRLRHNAYAILRTSPCPVISI